MNLKTFIPGKNAWVSTVKLGYPIGIKQKYFFESMVFKGNRHEITSYTEFEVDRYENEEEARRGHIEMVGRWDRPES